MTEVAAGSGLYGPGLFDGYRPLASAAGRVLRPVGGGPAQPRTATVLGGGWIASGQDVP